MPNPATRPDRLPYNTAPASLDFKRNIKIYMKVPNVSNIATSIKRSYAPFIKFMKAAENTQKRIEDINTTIQRMGNTAQQLAAPGIEFQQAIQNLSAATGISGKDLERLSQAARESGISSGIGATQALSAFSQLAGQIDINKTGIEGLIALQNKTITLSQATGMSTAEAAKYITDTVKQFGMQASEAGRIINVMAAGAKNGSAGIPELAESFKAVGSTASNAGLSIESTTGAIEVLSKNNIKGAQAGTALSGIIQKMQATMGTDFHSTSLEEAMFSLGPRLQDTAWMTQTFGKENAAIAKYLVENVGTIQDMTDKITNTNTATNQATTRTNTWAQKLKEHTAQLNDRLITLQDKFGGVTTAIQMAGKTAGQISSLNSLGKDFITVGKKAWSAGSDVVKFGKTFVQLRKVQKNGSSMQYLRTIAKSGTMGRVAAFALNGYNKIVGISGSVVSKLNLATLRNATVSKLSAFWTNVKTKAVALSTFITGAWRKMTAAATWIELRKTIVTRMHTLWTNLSSKAMWVGALITKGWSKITQVATFIQGQLSKALRAGRTVLVTGLIPAFTSAIATTWAWTAALLANPITWIVIGIVALIAAVAICWEKFAGFRAVILTIWDTIKGFGMAIFDFLVAPFKSAWKIIAGIGRGLGKLFTGDFKGMVDEFSNGFKDGFATGVEGFSKGVSGVIDSAKGISGNYEMHLTEERAKQEKKEQEKQSGKKQTQQTATGQANNPYPGKNLSGPGMPKSGIPDMTAGIPDFNMQEANIKMPDMKGIDMSGMGVDIPDMDGMDMSDMGIDMPDMSGIDLEGMGLNMLDTTEIMDMNDLGLNMPQVQPPQTSVAPTTATLFSRPPATTPEWDVINGYQSGQSATAQGVSRPGTNGSGQDFSAMSTFNAYSGIEQNTGNIRKNTTNNYQNATAGATAAGGPKIEVNFQPQINISAEMTQKSKDDLLAQLRRMASEITTIVEETRRKSGRGAYAIS